MLRKILQLKSPEDIMQTVYDAAESTTLFASGDIKVRINPYIHYNNGNTKNEFIHVFGNILEGRNTDQKLDLSNKIIHALHAILPDDIAILSINIRDFEKATYYNKQMI